MPTYEYACTECGKNLEVIQSFTDDALTECPECQGRLRKVFGNVGVTFKGSGFYKTDSRSKSTTGSKPSTEAGASSSSESSSASSSSDSSSPSDAKQASTSKPAESSTTSTPSKAS